MGTAALRRLNHDDAFHSQGERLKDLARRYRVWVALTLLCVVANHPLHILAAPPAALPKPAADSSRTIVSWLNSLNGRTASQVASELGPPTEQRTWDFRGKQEVLLHYELTGSPKAVVQVYFLGDRAIKASLQLLSD